MAAPRKTDDKGFAKSLGNIAKAIARASGDPIVKAMSAGQTLSLLANIIRLESESLRER